MAITSYAGHMGAAPVQMSAESRDHLVMYLSDRGWSVFKIAARLGLTSGDVAAIREGRVRDGE